MELRPIFSTLMRNKTGAILIALQVALTLAIVSNALFIITQRLEIASRPSGVDDEGQVFEIGIATLNEPEDPVAHQERDEALIRAVPGVEAVAWSNQVPLGQSGWGMGLFNSREQEQSTSWTGLYFTAGPLVDVLGLKIVEGRDFTPSDVETVDFDKERRFGAANYAPLPGSQRPERFLLWPMGVRSAGAMRQWGHHPVAFLGRRRFDDARLIELLFESSGR